MVTLFRKIVRAHGGDLMLESSTPVKTFFFFWGCFSRRKADLLYRLIGPSFALT